MKTVECPRCCEGAVACNQRSESDWDYEACRSCNGTGIATCAVCPNPAVAIVDGSTYVCAACKVEGDGEEDGSAHPVLDVSTARDAFMAKLWNAVKAGDLTTAAALMDLIVRINSELQPQPQPRARDMRRTAEEPAFTMAELVFGEAGRA